MSHVHEGPLATYNSLLDPHLSGYFSNTHIRRHLRKSKLISRKGEVISESKYRLLNARANHRKQVREMLAQAIVHKTLDMERQRQAEIRRRLDKISKIELVKRVKAERKFGYEDTIMDLLRPPSEVRRRRRDSARSYDSLPPVSYRTMTSSRSSLSQSQRSHSSNHQTRRKGSAGQRRGSKGRSRSYSRERPRSRERRRSRRSSISSTSSFDSESSESVREGHHITPHRASSQDRGSKRSKSPNDYDSDAHPPLAWKPHPPPKKAPANTPRDEHGHPIPMKKHVRGRVILHRQEPAFKHEKELQTFCEVKLKYLGGTYSALLPQEIVVEQQHCGGNTLTVFKERVKPKSVFSFTSKRHRGYPFGLTLYIDGHQDSTVSTCCEYKHRKGSLLGSKSSHFLFVGVSGAKPCYKCQVEAELSARAKKEKAKREERKKSEEKEADEGEYGDDFEESDGEKDKYEDDFDDSDKEGSGTARSESPTRSAREAKTSRSYSDEEKTAREIKSYEDELEPRSKEESEPVRSRSSKSGSERREGSLSSRHSVEIAVQDSDEEISTKEIVEHYLDSLSRDTVEGHGGVSPVNNDNAKRSPSPESSPRSVRSDKSSSSRSSKRSVKSASSVHSDRDRTVTKYFNRLDDDKASVKSDRSAKSDASYDSRKSSKSDKSDSSKKSKNSVESASSKKSVGSDKTFKSSGSHATIKSEKKDEPVVLEAPAEPETKKTPPIEQNSFYTLSTALAVECSRDADSKQIVIKNFKGSVDELVEILKINRDMMKLILANCQLNDAEIEKLTAALVESGCPLRELDLSENQFGLRGGLSVAHTLVPAKKSLTQLRLAKTPITQLPVTEILGALEANNINLSSLYLNNCIEDGGELSKEGSDTLAVLIRREGGKLRQMAISHISVEAVEKLCDSISNSWKSMSYVEFSSICGMTDVRTCPLKLTSGVVINNLSLVNNNLSYKQIMSFLKQWRSDKPTLRDVTVEPGNPLITDVGLSRLRKFLKGEPESDVTTSSDESENEAAMESISQTQTPIVSKPPLPPRKLSMQSSVSAKSEKLDRDDEKMSDKEGGESDDEVNSSASSVQKSESEKAKSDSEWGKARSEKAESEKVESEKAESEKVESEKAESEKAESEKAELEKAESEKATFEKAESEKVESEKIESGTSSSDEALTDRSSSTKASSSRRSKSVADSERLDSEVDSDSSSTTSDTTGTESQSGRRRVTLSTTSEETTPRASFLASSPGEPDDSDIKHITEDKKVPTGDSLASQLGNYSTTVELVGLDTAQVTELCKLLNGGSSLQTLRLKDCDLTDKVGQLSDALAKNTTLKELVLANCNLTSSDCGHLTSMVSGMADTLQTLSLRGNKLGDSGVAMIVKELSAHAQRAYNSRLQEQAKEIASKSLHEAIEKVHGSDAVRSDSLSSIATLGSNDCLKTSTTAIQASFPLRSLSLTDCKIGNATMEQVISLLRYGCIDELLLANNYDITMFAWKEFLNAVGLPQSTLRKLDISSNPIGKPGVATGSPLTYIPNLSLDYLNLSGCQLDKELMERVSSQSKRIKTLKLKAANESKA